jgi:peptide/nickel transport system ATP-binding protein
MSSAFLELRDATKVYGGGFFGSGQAFTALDQFNLSIPEDQATIITIAGESGSGKTTLANAILGFLSLSSGQVLYKGLDIQKLSRAQRLDYRREVQAIFQDPYEVFNPFYPVRHVFQMVLSHLHTRQKRGDWDALVTDALNVVGLRAEEVLDKYPHQLSGGQRQRIMFARAYLLRPRLVVADEPVSAVDASLRATILDLMMRLRDQYGISFLYITHDLSTAYQVGGDIYILYQGRVVEHGLTADVIENPKHPYVQLLVSSVPVPDPTVRWEANAEAKQFKETEADTSTGCRFYARCPQRMARCLQHQPPLFPLDDAGHETACYLYDRRKE